MNSLINYSDSSSDSSESDDVVNSGHLSAQSCHHVWPQLESRKTSNETMSTNKTGEVNYFNLDSSSSSDDCSEDHITNIETVNSESLESTSNCPAVEAVKRVICEDWTLVKPVVDARKENDKLNNHASFSKHSIDSTRSENEPVMSKRLKTVVNETTASPPITCFTVHQQIKPFAHTSRSINNRLPRKLIREFAAHGGAVNRINWCCPQYSHLLLSASMDTTIKIWNIFETQSLCIRTLFGHEKAVKDAMWSTSGRSILSCSYDRTAAVFDVENAARVCSFPHQEFVTCVKYHPVNANLFVCGSKNIVLGWDVRCPNQPIRRYTYKARFGQVLDICFIDNGTQFVTSNDLVSRDSADRNIIVWDFSSGAVLSNQVYQERYTCARICKHPSEQTFIAQTQGDYIAQFSTAAPYRMNKCKRYEGHKVSGYDVGCDISPDGQLLVSGSADGRMCFYNYHNTRSISNIKLEDTSDVVLNAAWHPLLPSTVGTGTWSGRIGLYQ